jgi:hypothetical protein
VYIESDERNKLLIEIQVYRYNIQTVIKKYEDIVKNDIVNTSIDIFCIRRELAELFRAENKFQLQKMDDPVEALFAILNSLHSYVFAVKSLKFIIDRPCNPNCLSHECFWFNMLEQTVCLFLYRAVMIVEPLGKCYSMIIIILYMKLM